jgi:hypothetical protein
MSKEQQKKHIIDMMEKDQELGLYDIFNDEKRQGVKDLIDTHKQYFYCSDRLELDENERCVTQCDHCAGKHKQRLEKYSERFDNDKSEIGNPDTWGKRIIEEAAYQYAEPYRCPATNENEYCKHDIISAFNKGAKWQQERSYSEEEVIKLLIYCKDRFGGSGLEDYTHDDEVKEWFEQFKNK